MEYKDAVIEGPRNRYRYSLKRSNRPWSQLEGSRTIAFIGVNPSTADAENDDPTIRKCWGFTERWGYDGFIMLNLFAFRATDPGTLKRITCDPVGPRNNEFLAQFARRCDKTILMYGNNGTLYGRDLEVLSLLRTPETRPLYCLKQNRTGTPAHVLYLPNDSELKEFRG